jgi:hypothetical protein
MKDDLNNFKKITNPSLHKYYTGTRLTRYDTRHSKRKDDIIVDHVGKDWINYSILNTDYNQMFGRIQIQKESFNKDNIVYINIALKYGLQRDQDIKKFYARYIIIYKITSDKFQEIATNGIITTKRIKNKAHICAEEIMKRFIKYIRKI